MQPAVLEQLRLLTNLETNTKKLLQVILIGQPELQQLLQRNDLRQLAQRITARYHLLPLNLAEVQHYVRFRLQVAGCQRPVFSDKAVKRLYELSGGIPRLVNLLADRAMLAAYGQQQPIVQAGEIQRAAAEILPAAVTKNNAANTAWIWLLLAVSGILLGFLLATQLLPQLRGD